jgi:hypothetical protein
MRPPTDGPAAKTTYTPVLIGGDTVSFESANLTKGRNSLLQINRLVYALLRTSTAHVIK